VSSVAPHILQNSLSKKKKLRKASEESNDCKVGATSLSSIEVNLEWIYFW